jgi:hypothetical protein
MQPVKIVDFCKTALTRILMDSSSATPKITPPQLNGAINELNLITDSWNADGGTIYTQQFYTFPLTAGQQTYTIGPSNTANFNTGTQPRPSYLEFASYQLTTGEFPFIDLPMRILDASEWASIVVKDISTTVGFYIYMDEAYPLANVNIWPFPSTAGNLVLTTWSSLNSALGENDSISLPPGYARGLSLELSIALAPYYGKSGDPTVAQLGNQLAQIKKNIAWVNLRGGRLSYSDQAQSARDPGGIYDANSDQVL